MSRPPDELLRQVKAEYALAYEQHEADLEVARYRSAVSDPPHEASTFLKLQNEALARLTEAKSDALRRIGLQTIAAPDHNAH